MKKLFLFFVFLTLATGCLFVYGMDREQIRESTKSFLVEYAWQQTKHSGALFSPWPWLGSAPVAHMEIPAQEKKFFVMKGVRSEVLAIGPGWHDDSALPGSVGISMISGLPEAGFGVLRQINRDDRIHIEDVKGIKHSYTVTEIDIVQENNLGIDYEEGESVLLLTAAFKAGLSGNQKALQIVVIARRDAHMVSESSLFVLPEDA